MFHFLREKSLHPYIVLLLLNLASHFLPFERLSPTTDEYEMLAKLQTSSLMEIYRSSLHYPDRPLTNVYLATIEKWVHQNQLLSVTLLFLISSIFAFSVYYLLLNLLSNPTLAFLGALFHLLLPNKLDLFYGLDMTNILIPYTLTVISFISFTSFIKTEKKRFFILSLFIYAVIIFWYTQPFFLPVVLAGYALFYSRKKIKQIFGIVLFGFPALFYIFLQGPGRYLFGLGRPTYVTQDTDVIYYNLTSGVFDNFIGHYMIRNILYGLYQFPKIEHPWLWIIIISDMAILYWFIKWIKSAPNLTLKDSKLIYLSMIMFITFLLPSSFWLITGRHTALASIGIITIGLYLLKFKIIQRHRAKILASMLLFLMIICQGIAWTHIVNRRINNTLYRYLVKNKDALLKSDRIIFNQYSFAKNIPYGWPQFLESNGLNEDLLDTFWGAMGGFPGLAGLPSMIQVALGQRPTLWVARSEIHMDHDKLTFTTYNKSLQTLPETGSAIISYDQVFKNKYDNGNLR